MNREPLTFCITKLERAKTLISELNVGVEAFNASRPYEIGTNVYFDRKAWRFIPKCVPPDLEAIAADAIHNIRTPLDKMLTEIADKRAPRDDKRHRGFGFPTSREGPEGFKRALTRLEEYLAGDVIEFLRKTEAYPGGKGHILQAVHDMDLDDKHQPLLIPTKIGMQFIRADKFGVTDGFLLTTLGAQWHGNIEPTFNVAFGQTGVSDGKPAVEFLEDARQAVAGTLAEFRASLSRSSIPVRLPASTASPSPFFSPTAASAASGGSGLVSSTGLLSASAAGALRFGGSAAAPRAALMSASPPDCRPDGRDARAFSGPAPVLGALSA